MNHPRSIALALLVACSLALTACSDRRGEPLITVKDEKEALHIAVRLSESGIRTAALEPATENRETVFRIEVAQHELADARRVLVTYDLPRRVQPGFAELFDDSRLIPTASEEHARLVHATAGELARTFELWDRIVAARVILNIPQRDPYTLADADPAPPTAMIALRYIPAPGDDQDRPISDDDARAMVNAAIAGVIDESAATAPATAQVVWAPAEALPRPDSQRTDETGTPPPSETSPLRLYVFMATTGLFAVLTAIFGFMLLSKHGDADDQEHPASPGRAESA